MTAYATGFLAVVPVLAAIVVGCGGSAGPPAGPKHVPSDTQEAATPCPKQRKVAQEAREALLGASEQSLVGAAARAVMMHAECEASAALALPTPVGTQDQILAGIRTVREAVRDASGLFGEVVRYQVEGPSQEALLADARLTLGFASLVGNVSPPADLDAAAAMQFRRELAEAKSTLETQAGLLAEQALASEGAAAIRGDACKLLAEMGRASPECQ